MESLPFIPILDFDMVDSDNLIPIWFKSGLSFLGVELSLIVELSFGGLNKLVLFP